MTLEFHKLSEQVERMGQAAALEEDEMADKAEIAVEVISRFAAEGDLPYIQARVDHAVSLDAGYRGARPLDEPIAGAHPAPSAPDSATLIATDGSQIYPNRHGAALYYLINIGTIVLREGSGAPPEIISEPYLSYGREHVRSADYSVIGPTTIAARRTVAEMSALAEHAWLRRDEARPLLALMDGPLLFFMGSEVPDRDQLRNVYYAAMTRIMDVQAGLAGYTEAPRSRYVIGLLHLLSLDEEDVSQATLATDGKLEGLQDRWVFRKLLGPGERSSLFVQMSPQNKEYRQQAGDTHEICFFYLNVAPPGDPALIARVEVPMWVASDRRMVGQLQAELFRQCQHTVRRYPYVLTRADELAVVKGDEQRQLDVMIRVSLTRHGVRAVESEKQATKDAARGGKTRHKVG
jgi:hypothetical protein